MLECINILLSLLKFSSNQLFFTNLLQFFLFCFKITFYLRVPKTSFNPRFHPCTSEPSLHPLLSSSLYKFQSQQPSSREWRVKEVPLYVHENLHMGHFFNKTLKDINNRYKMMQDWKIDYKLTFGLTGKLIENAALAWEQVQFISPFALFCLN